METNPTSAFLSQAQVLTSGDFWANSHPKVKDLYLVNGGPWLPISLLLAIWAFCHFSGINAWVVKRQAKLRIDPISFLFHSFMCGLLCAGLGMSIVITDAGRDLLTCATYNSWVELGFRGYIKVYFMYICFLLKMLQTVDTILTRSTLPVLMLMSETMMVFLAIKFDSGDNLWLPGVIHTPAAVMMCLYRVYGACGMKMSKSQYRPLRIYLALSTVALIAHGIFSIAASCRSSPYVFAFEIVYAILGYFVYPQIYLH